MTVDQKHIKNFARHMLQGRIFMGSFEEKRYVNVLKTYRDVVSVSTNETNLIHDLNVVRKRIKDYFKIAHWIGITNTDIKGVSLSCLWVELPEDITFNKYWFKIKSVKFADCEAMLVLKVLNLVNPKEEISNVSSSSNNISNNFEDDIEQTINTLKENAFTGFRYFLHNVLTIHNTKEVIVFLSLLLGTMLSGSVQLLQFMCDFLLKFMREFNSFIKAISPLVLGFFNLIAKIIAGFYMLIAMLWRDMNRPVIAYRQVLHTNHNYQRALPPTNRSNVIITELE